MKLKFEKENNVCLSDTDRKKAVKIVARIIRELKRYDDLAIEMAVTFRGKQTPTYNDMYWLEQQLQELRLYDLNDGIGQILSHSPSESK